MRSRFTQRRRRANALAVFGLVTLGVCGLVLGAGFVAGQWSQAHALLGQPAADLNPLEQLAYTAYLTARSGDLAQPAGSDATPQHVTVAPGATASAVAEQLAAQGLVADAQLLSFFLRYTGADQNIEAGDFILRQTMTVPQIARALTDAKARELAVRLPEGWRREQLAATLAANPQLHIPAETWLTLTGPQGPRLGTYSFYSDLPPGASLEGFLLPDTYLLRPGATAPDVLNKALANFDARLTPAYRAALNQTGLTLYQAVIVASLIEREAVVDDERPLIASVILNRLAAHQALEIDATVQYAIGSAENWWPPVNNLDFRSIASPYNTYYVNGLPAGPIANPSPKSLDAVAHPAKTDYYFYRALCDGSHRHAFAATYQEHLNNACP